MSFRTCIEAAARRSNQHSAESLNRATSATIIETASRQRVSRGAVGRRRGGRISELAAMSRDFSRRLTRQREGGPNRLEPKETRWR